MPILFVFMWKNILNIHEKIKQDWRLLALVSYILVASLTLILQEIQQGQKGEALDGLLFTLASILATLVVTTFSFVFVALQLASVQFSPRIIRSFFEYDHFSRFFLWSFLACVAFLLLLQYFHFSDASLIYPKFGIIGAFYLIVLVFPLFIHHIVDNINASSITQNIAQRTVKEIEFLYDNVGEIPQKQEVLKINALKSGYLDSINFDELMALVPAENRSPIKIKPHIGSFVLEGSVLADICYLPEDKEFFEQRLLAFSHCFEINKFRSYKQDIPFGIRQLVDIAIKAISPAVNDPTTALNCIDYLGQIIKKAALSQNMSKQAKVMLSRSIFIREFTFEQMVDLAFDQIYFWGKEDYIVVRHLIKTISHLLPFVPEQEKLLVLIRQIEDFELNYLHEGSPQNGPFIRKEHRNSLRDYLLEFYQKAIYQIDTFDSSMPELIKTQQKYAKYVQLLRNVKE